MIDGDRWIAQRLEFLRGVLSTDIPDDQRKLIEEEMEKLRKERGIHVGGPRRRWFPSRWIGRRRTGN
jgi:hypothetical protein